MKPIQAGIIEFSLDNTSGGLLFGNSFTNVQTGLTSDGVTFDAQITVQGSGNLSQNTQGLGVQGGISALINDNESLTLNLAIVPGSVSGGTVVFDGFTGMNFNSYSPGNDVAGLSTTASTPGDIIANLPDDPTFAAQPSGIFLVGDTATSGSGTSFRIDSIFASFSGTTTAASIPEPSSLSLLLVSGLILIRRH